jgi:putative SOS response-associated peptidase YedK
MCGRVRLSSDVSEIKLVFSIPSHRPAPNIAPSWNVAPTDPLPVVRYDAQAGERSLDVMRWGLVPFWAKEIKVGLSNINAKAEGIEGKPAFREAFQRGGVSCRWIISTSGRRRRRASSLTQLRWLTGG